MAERKSDRWISITQSVLLHAALVAALVYGWWAYQQRPRPPAATLAIEAVAVDAHDARTTRPKVAPPPPAPVKPPEPQEDVGPPAPTPEETAQRRAEEQHKADEERQAQERKLTQEREAAEKREAEKQAAEKQAAETKAREEAEAKKQAVEAEQKRLADTKRRADDKRKAEEARLRTERESELKKSLEEEERVMTARSSGALASWQAQITARIQRAWLRPPSARPGIDCVVYVTQVPGGEVVNVRLGTCNGDQAVRESIQSAVYRASPLPPPSDPALFERNLEIRFVPAD